MGKLKIIYLAILNRGKKMIKKEDIVNLIKDYNKKFGMTGIANVLWYLSRHNYIKRIFLDYYYINSIEERELGTCMYEDKELLFEVLNKEKIKWYIGLNSSKYYLGEIWQFLIVLTIINNKFSVKRKINSMEVKFIKIKENLIFGLVARNTKNKIKFYCSNIQKTNLDLLYFKLTKKIFLDKKTKEYAKRFPKWLLKR